jgi:hypothetical protein
MLRKNQIVTTLSRTQSLAKRIAMLAFLIAGMTVTAFAQGGNSQGQNNNDQGTHNSHSVPEIAVGAGISAVALAGGGLLLLADRMRARKRAKS